MSIDPWLRELANVNRERQNEERSRLDERWDRLSAGDLSPEEEAELRALAESSDEARDAYEAFRPLGPEFHAGVVGAIREQGLVPDAGIEEKPAKLLPFRGRAGTVAVWGSLAAAAVLLVMIQRPPAPISSSYMASLSDGDRIVRGSAAEAGEGKVFSSGSRLTLVVEPLESFERQSKVEARAFAAGGPGLIPLELTPEIAESGILRLQGEIGKEIRLSPGTWKVWVVVCRPGKLPTVDQVRGKLNAGSIEHAGCQAAATEPFEVRDQA